MTGSSLPDPVRFPGKGLPESGINSGHAEVALAVAGVGWVLDKGATGDFPDIDDFVVIRAENEAVLAWDLVGKSEVAALFLNRRLGGDADTAAAAGGGRTTTTTATARLWWLLGKLGFSGSCLSFLQLIPLFLDFLLFRAGNGPLRRIEGYSIPITTLVVWITGSKQDTADGGKCESGMKIHKLKIGKNG